MTFPKIEKVEKSHFEKVKRIKNRVGVDLLLLLFRTKGNCKSHNA